MNWRSVIWSYPKTFGVVGVRHGFLAFHSFEAIATSTILAISGLDSRNRNNVLILKKKSSFISFRINVWFHFYSPIKSAPKASLHRLGVEIPVVLSRSRGRCATLALGGIENHITSLKWSLKVMDPTPWTRLGQPPGRSPLTRKVRCY